MLSHFRVLAPGVPLEQLLEESPSEEYMRQVAEATLGVEGLAEQLAGLLDIPVPKIPPVDPLE